MRRRVVANQPRFRLRWLASRERGEPGWLSDRQWVPPGNRALYRRAKDGLLAVLSALDRTGPVLLPGYVPAGLVATVLAAGHEVRHYPVRADLTLPAADVEERIDSLSPAAVVFVHYLGFADPGYPRLRAAAEANGATVVEDCARALFGRGPDGDLLGSSGDVALYCVYKTLPAPNGGLIVRRDGAVEEPVRPCSEWRDLGRTVGAAVAGRVGFDPRGSPPSVGEERRSASDDHRPAHPSCAPGSLSRRALQRVRPGVVQSARLERYRTLRERLGRTDVEVVTPRAPDGAAPYGLGVLAPSEADRSRLLEGLRRARLPGEVLTWLPVYRHEAVEAMEGASALRRRLLVLPTHQQVPEAALPEMADCAEAMLG